MKKSLLRFCLPWPTHPLLSVRSFIGMALCLVPCLLYAGEPKGPLASFANKRTWADKSGQFKIDGNLKFADAKSVQILKSDSKVVTVPIDKLSDGDRAFVEGFLAAEAAIAKAGLNNQDNPFAGGVPVEPSKASNDLPKTTDENVEPENASELVKRKTIATGFKPISITPNKAFWSTKPVIPFPKIEFEETGISTPLPKPFFSGFSLMAGGKSGTVVLNAYQQGKGGPNAKDYSKFLVLNCATGDQSPIVDSPIPWKLMAISADGTRVAAVRVEGFDKGNDIALFRIVQGRLQPEIEFTAGGGSWDEVSWVGFLPSNRLATLSQKGNLTFWDVENKNGVKAIKRGNLDRALPVELSAAGELMALSFGKAVAFVETTEGRMVGCIVCDQEAKDLSFSPDGMKIAIYRPFSVSIHNLQDGEEIYNVAVSEGNPGARVQWFGQYISVGPVVYDVERGVPIWTYEGKPGSNAALGDYLIAGFAGEKSSSVLVTKIPHDEALRTAKEIDPNTAYAIKPGSSVSLQFQFGETPDDKRDAIEKALVKKVESVGWVLSEGAPNVILVKIEQGKQEEAEYYQSQGFGPIFSPFRRPTGPSEKVSFRPWNHSLIIQSEGKEVYKSMFTATAPHGLQSKQGETTQEAVNRACQPSPTYFANLMLPPHLLKAQYQGGLGKSKLSGEGLR